MEFRTFDLKNTFTDSQGEQYLDLSQATFAYNYDAGIRNVYRVSADQAMRPDLVSVQFFGTDEYTDAICKINGIFNPFSLLEGQLLVIPNMKQPDQHYKQAILLNNNKLDSNDVRAQFIDSDRMSKKDANRIDRLKEKAKGKTAPATPLPPNVMPPGKSSKTFNETSISLGTNLNSRK